MSKPETEEQRKARIALITNQIRAYRWRMVDKPAAAKAAPYLSLTKPR